MILFKTTWNWYENSQFWLKTLAFGDENACFKSDD